MATQQPFLAPDVLKKQYETAQNQRYAQMLMEQGQDTPQGQMVGNHYVAPSITQHLAKALQTYQGRKMADDMPEQLAGLQQAQQDFQMGQFGFGSSPQALAQGLQGGQSSQAMTLPGMSEQESMTVFQNVGPSEYSKLLSKARIDDAKPVRPTSLAQNLEAAGLQPGSPEYQRAMMAAINKPGTTVNVGQSEYGTIPPGWEVFTDPQSGARSMRPIAGGPVEQEAEALASKAEGAQRQKARAGTTVVQDLQRAIDLIPELGTLASGEGVVGGIARTSSAKIPGTVANRITQFTESALSNVGLDTLQTMRENSTTGGALGQVPIQQQKRLEQVLGSLNIDQPPAVLEANIKRVMNIYTDIIHGTPAERSRAVAQGKMTPEQSDEIDGYYYELPFDERGRPIDQQAMPEQQRPALSDIFGG